MNSYSVTNVDQRDVCRAKKDEIVKAIASALKEAKVKHKLEEVNAPSYSWSSPHYIRTDGVTIDVVDEKRFSRWNGKIRVVVSYFRQKKQFPERKDGFDYAAIAQCVKTFLQQLRDYETREERDRNDREKTEIVEASLNADYPLLQSYNNIPSVRMEHRGQLNSFSLHLAGMDESMIRKILDALTPHIVVDGGIDDK